MNSKKTLIVTVALASRLLSIADGLTNVHHDRPEVENLDGARLMHEHPDFGTQTLLLERISEQYFSVSFAGHASYLELIESDGWLNTGRTLVNYLESLGEEINLDLNELLVYSLNDDILVVGVGEDTIDLNDPMLQTLSNFKPAGAASEEATPSAADTASANLVETIETIGHQIGEVVVDAVEDISDTIETVVSDAREAAVDAADSVEEVLEAAAEALDPNHSLRYRVTQKLKTPAGLACATLGLAVLGATTYFGIKALVPNAPAAQI